jgi:hypothetical protein
MGFRDTCVKGLSGLVLGASLVAGGVAGNVDRAYAESPSYNRVFAAQAGWDLFGGLMRDGNNDYNKKVAEQRARRRVALGGGGGVDRVVYMPVVVEREPEKRLVIREWYNNGKGGVEDEYGERVDGIFDNRCGLVFDITHKSGDVHYTINNLSDGSSQNFSTDTAMLIHKDELGSGKYQFIAKDSQGNLLDERKLYFD